MEEYRLDSLRLLSGAIHNTTAEISENADIFNIIHECYGQNCALLAISAAISSAENRPAAEKLKSYLINRKMKEAIRAAAVGKMLRALENGGHNPVVIKGAVLANLYPDPLLRESVDTDLFFRTGEERDRAQEFLLANGGAIKNDDADKKHSSLTFPGVGTVELHKSLYDADFQRLHLKGEQVIKRPLTRVTLRNGLQITTLDKTDTIKYIFCHMMQHFLFSRCDLRQICDILLYIKEYKNEIDEKELYDFLHNTGYVLAFETVISVGIKYLGFSAAELFPLRRRPAAAEAFLADCFNGCARGVWGKAPTPRGSGIFSVEFNEKKFSGEKAALRRSTLTRIMRGIFPSKKQLNDIYPYSADNPLLLPAAWANNLRDLAAGVLANRGKLRERKPLLKEMDLL